VTASRAFAAAVAATAATATALLLAGCGSAVAGGSARAAAPPPAPPLATSFSAAGGGSFAVVEMGGSSRQHNNFWQLFARAAGPGKWKLATPAGVASNGGLVVSAAGTRSLVTGFRPSQDLLFSPLASSADDGARWSQRAPVDPGLAAAPEALAAGPGGKLIALTAGGGVQLGTQLGAAWSALISVRALARTAAGQACGLTRLTAAAFTAGGTPLLAGDCAKPGIAGIFALQGGSWQAAGPALPASLAGSRVAVLGLRTAGSQTTALLAAGPASQAGLLAAWSASGGLRWSLSPLLRPGAAAVRSTSLWAGGSAGLVLAGNRGYTITGTGTAWRQLPVLPAGTQALANGPSGQLDALVAVGSTLTDWRLRPAAASWQRGQALQVSVPYGSSS